MKKQLSLHFGVMKLLVCFQDSTRSMARYTGRDRETGQGSASGRRSLHGEDSGADQAAQGRQNTVPKKGECVYSSASGRGNLHGEDSRADQATQSSQNTVSEKGESLPRARLQVAEIYMEKITKNSVRKR